MVRCSASTSWTACPLPRPGTQQCSDLALLMGDAVKSAFLRYRRSGSAKCQVKPGFGSVTHPSGMQAGVVELGELHPGGVY
ncbi:hypothetical protein SRIMM317S_02159 [Streptomyces rimosus subsp. rimosus]